MQALALPTHLKTASHVALVGVPVGVVVGLAIAAYDYIVTTLLWVPFTGTLSTTVLCLLPCIGMLLTGLIMETFRVKTSSMADEVVRAYHHPPSGLRPQESIPKLAASIATMGFGCSAGMEGASKWLGASLAARIQSIFNGFGWLKWAHGSIETTMLVGASAGISAIFRAPLTGTIMGLESPYKKDLAYDALLHGLVASSVSYATFVTLRNGTPYFPIHFSYSIQLRDLLFCIPLGVVAGVGSNFFLTVLSFIKSVQEKYAYSKYLKYLLGGILLSGLALLMNHLVGEPITLQAGLPTANKLLAGRFDSQTSLLIFVAKLLATAITFGMGGVGGLFVPSATMGAGLGAFCDLYFQPSQPGVFTLVGIAAFTGASYNSLLFSAIFIAEATGNPALVVPGILASCTAYLVSTGISNSPSQKTHRSGEPRGF